MLNSVQFNTFAVIKIKIYEEKFTFCIFTFRNRA